MFPARAATGPSDRAEPDRPFKSESDVTGGRGESLGETGPHTTETRGVTASGRQSAVMTWWRESAWAHAFEARKTVS